MRIPGEKTSFFDAAYGLSVRLTWWLLVGLMIGLLFGLPFGLAAASQHGALRLLMYMQRISPLRHVRWLDYAVHLRGASGGYVFIHRIVQDYFNEAAATHPRPDRP